MAITVGGNTVVYDDGTFGIHTTGTTRTSGLYFNTADSLAYVGNTALGSNTANGISFPGDLIFISNTSAVSNTSQFLRANGAIVLQSSAPGLFSKVGLLRDQTTWTTRTIVIGALLVDGVVYGSNGWLVSSNAGAPDFMRSTDGITWSNSDISSTSFNRGFFANNTYIVFNSGDTSKTFRTSSPALSSFTTVSFGPDNNDVFTLYDVGAMGSRRIVVGAGEATYPNYTYTNATGQWIGGNNATINAATAGLRVQGNGNGSVVIMVTSTGSIFRSTDFAVNWTQLVTNSLNVTANTTSIVHNTANDVIVATASTNRYLISGSNGALISTGTIPAAFRKLLYGNGLYVGFTNLTVYTSTDANTWTLMPNPGWTNRFQDADFGGNTFVATGGSGTFNNSPSLLSTQYLYTYNSTTEFEVPSYGSLGGVTAIPFIRL